MILVSPAEHIPVLRTLGPSSAVPEQYGADFLVIVPGLSIGVQRKAFPADLVGSLTDGRLSTSLRALTLCPVRILLLEGRPAWTESGQLIGSRHQFSQRALRSLTMSAQVELGVSTHWSADPTDSAEFIRNLEVWAEKPEHQSLFRRPGVSGDEYGREAMARDRMAWILQGFGGIGYTLACRIIDHVGRLPLRWDLTEKELLALPGIGKEKVRQMTEFVHAAEPHPEPKGRKRKGAICVSSSAGG